MNNNSHENLFALSILRELTEKSFLFAKKVGESGTLMKNTRNVKVAGIITQGIVRYSRNSPQTYEQNNPRLHANTRVEPNVPRTPSSEISEM